MHLNDPAHIDLLRRFGELVVTTELSDDDWAEVRRVLEPLVDGRDDGGGGVSAYARWFRDPGAHERPDVFHPLALSTTPVFPVIDVEATVGGVAAHMTFGPAHEGPPGLVHGGFISAAFDIVVSAAATEVEPFNVTRWLKIRFLRPTPLGERLTFSAAARPAEGRLIEVEARLAGPDGRTRAKAEAQCAVVDRARFADRAPRPSAGPSTG